jgi:hypothetical protein
MMNDDKHRQMMARMLAGWKGARPPKGKKRTTVYPIPPHAKMDPLDIGDVAERKLERLEFDHETQEFMKRRGQSRKDEKA